MPGKATGTVRVRFTSEHERGENRSERQVDMVLCAGAAARRAEKGLNFIVWNFAWDRLASRLYAATATTFLMKNDHYHTASREILPITPPPHKFHHFPRSVLTKPWLFSLSWKTTCLERLNDSMVTLYIFHYDIMKSTSECQLRQNIFFFLIWIWLRNTYRMQHSSIHQIFAPVFTI